MFPGGNGGRCVRLTTLPHVPIVLKSGSLNLLEPSGAVEACNGIAVEKVNPLNAELNPICHLLVLLGAHLILHISRISVKEHILFSVFFVVTKIVSFMI